ncbi:MAG: PAS domain-containing sensor histidine kinase [Deltaproteobacteria bacterium]|nr:PAS domain-containing sensor histidine kinase [Deltaproteobacteria bacterium]
METRSKEQLLRELKESEDRYRAVTETSIDAIITASAKDKILTWNKGAEKIFGYRAEDVLGRSVTIIIPERYKNAHYDGVRRFLKTGEKHIIGRKLEMVALRKDQTEFPIELTLSFWESDSGIYFGAIIRDITDRRQIEQIREDVQRMMRHDLKSPLIGITGLARRLLKGKNLTDRQRKAASLIQTSGEKTLKILDRSRDLFQMEQGSYELNPQPVNLMEILDRIKNQLEPLTLQKKITIQLTISEPSKSEKPEMVKGDEDLLEMMLANLLKNAIEASPDKAPIGVSIKWDQTDDQKMHAIDIHNRTEIPKEIRDHFFEAYTTSGKKGGMGLGTYNASLIARTHHGNIRFTTSEAEGTHVIVSLPSKLQAAS